MKGLFLLVLIIASVAAVGCLDCVWETRFDPQKPAGFHYPRSRPGEMNIISKQVRGRNRNGRRLQETSENSNETNTNTEISQTLTEQLSNKKLHKNYYSNRTITPKQNSKQPTIAIAKEDTTSKIKGKTFQFDSNDTALHEFKTRVWNLCSNLTNFKDCGSESTSINKNVLAADCFRNLLMPRSCRQDHTTALNENDDHRFASEGTSRSSSLHSDLKTLHIVGLFAMSGEYPAGVGYLPAALLAIRQINNDPNILPGYKLQLNVHDTRCSPEWGLDGLYTELYNTSRTSIMTLGTTCSHVTEPTATVSNIWGMVQNGLEDLQVSALPELGTLFYTWTTRTAPMCWKSQHCQSMTIQRISYSAVSPHLSNKTIFPSFFRVTTPEQILTTSRIQMFKAMNWTRVHTIYQNFKLFSTLNEQMIKDLRDSNITVVSSNMFTTDPYRSVRRLKEADARIIIGSFYEDMARMVMCEAYKLRGDHAWYKNVVWFLPSFLDRGWVNVPYHNCFPENIAEVVGQYFTIGSINYNLDPSYKPVGNISPDVFEDYNLYNETAEDIPVEFLHLYSHCKESVSNCSLYAVHRAPEAFDAIWAIGLALNNSLEYLRQTGDERRLEDFDYGKKYPGLSCIIRQAMQNVTFPALSGFFHFNSHGEGSSNVGIERYNNKLGRNFTVVGSCINNDDDDKWSCYIHKQKIRWNTSNGLPPYDGIQTRMRAIEIVLGSRIAFFILACIGIITSFSLLVFNIWNRNHRIIKMSSPRLNNLILVGSALGYVDIILQDNGDKVDEVELIVCKIRLFTKPLSFCLMFGSLFAKTWRVYQIFTAGAHAYKLNKKILRDSSLFLLVAGLVAITCGILGTWMVISPQGPVITNITVLGAQDSSQLDVDIVYVNQFHHCTSQLESEFTIGLSVFYGLMMIFGTFLAIQTRKVSYPEFNDSRLIAMAIYNVVVVEPVGRIMTWAINDKPELRYALYGMMQITMSSVTLGLLFVPKIISYRRHNKKLREQHSVSTDFRLTSNRTTEHADGQCHEGTQVQEPYNKNGQHTQKETHTISSPKMPGTLSSPDEELNQDKTNGGDDLENTINISDIYNMKGKFQKDENRTSTKKKFGSIKISPLALTEVVLQESLWKTHRSVLFKRSFSDTNIWSTVQKADADALKGIDIDSLAIMTGKKPAMMRRFSSTYHDETFKQEVKFKAGVKVKAWTGMFGRSSMDMKASWKQKSYTKKSDTSSKVDFILE